jgi:cytochrome c oxidase cbb3-type subunit 3
MTPKRDELLNHDADGIREFDNALPRWWLYGFYFTIAFAIVYLINYHLLAKPLFGKSTLAAEYAADVEQADRLGKRRTPAGGALTLLTDPAGIAKGAAIFNSTTNLCFTCHRPDLGGLVGPNLTDEYWRHGCTVGEIVRNVTTGFPEKGMLPYGSGAKLSDEQVLQVVSYVMSKQGSHPDKPKPVDPAVDKRCGS